MSLAAEIVLRLQSAGCVFAEDEARLLLASIADPALLEAAVGRRIAGEPLEQVLGWAEFCGLRVLIDPGVFVPRRRTEFLVATALRLDGSVAVDLCCGSGAIGAALAAARPGTQVHAADVDPVAVRCARRNLPPPAQVHLGDLFEALPATLRGRVDLLLANAPYVPADEIEFMPGEARLHEPRATLDGGGDGLDVHRRIARHAGEWLAPGGHLLIETSERQALAAVALFAGHGLAGRVETSEEYAATVVIGTRI